MESNNKNFFQEEIIERITRLRKSKNILGQPDMIHQLKTKITSSFLSKDKKQEIKQSYYVTGLNLPTTAHWSSFIKSYLNNNQKNVTLKVKIFIFDCFKEIDLHIEISIPGSLQLKAYNMHGQPCNVQQSDYQRAYYSSILRSLYPIYSSKLKIFHQVHKYSVLKQFLINFIPFSYTCQLRTFQQYQSEPKNNALELLLNFILTTKCMNLGQLTIKQLLKINEQQTAFMFQLQLLYLKKDYSSIILKTSQILIQNPTRLDIKQIQLRCLARQKKYNQAKILGQIITKQGISNKQAWKILADSYVSLGKQSYYLKVINTGLTINYEDQKKIWQLAMINPFEISVQTTLTKRKSNKLSDYPQLCFNFDNNYLNRQQRLILFKQALNKVNRQKQLLYLIDKIDNSLSNVPLLFQLIVRFQKNKGWNKLIQLRSQSFWLESDFKQYQNHLKNSISTIVSPKSMNSQSFSKIVDQIQQNPKTPGKNIGKNQNFQERKQTIGDANQSFQGNFSQIQDQQQNSMPSIQLCSKRAHTRRISYLTQRQQSKILCNASLQKIFITLFEDLKLQLYLQKWTEKLALQNARQNSKQKNQLLALIMIKKGFLHKKLQRKRKCEQSFKTARKYSQSLLVNLISSYSLAQLYLQSRNNQGVEFYIVEVVKTLVQIGITVFDVIPQWSKQFLSFIIQTHGPSIVNKIEGPLQELILLWLEIDNDVTKKTKTKQN